MGLRQTSKERKLKIIEPAYLFVAAFRNAKMLSAIGLFSDTPAILGNAPPIASINDKSLTTNITKML